MSVIVVMLMLMSWWAVLPQWHVIVILSVRPCVCVCVCVCVFHTDFSATVNSKCQKHLVGIMIIHVYRSSIFVVFDPRLCYLLAWLVIFLTFMSVFSDPVSS